jgi:hypothetical protein
MPNSNNSVVQFGSLPIDVQESTSNFVRDALEHYDEELVQGEGQSKYLLRLNQQTIKGVPFDGGKEVRIYVSMNVYPNEQEKERIRLQKRIEADQAELARLEAESAKREDGIDAEAS